MSKEKLFTAKEAAQAVLAKAAALAQNHELSKAETGHEKGVHTAAKMTENKGGRSEAGARHLERKSDPKSPAGKDVHAAVLGEMKSMPKPDLGKAEDGMKAAPSTDKNAPGEKAQDTPAGVKASPNPARPQAHENGNPAPGAFPQNEQKYGAELKGHLKLAKFVGRMEEKRKAKAVPAQPAPHAPKEAVSTLDKAETGHERGVAKQGVGANGTSFSGSLARVASNTSASPSKEEMIAGAKQASIGRMMEQSKIKPKLDKAEDATKMSGKSGTLASKETGNEMGVHTKSNRGASQGISSVGARLRDVPHVSEKEGKSITQHAKQSHKTMLIEMKSTPKPKLPA